MKRTSLFSTFLLLALAGFSQRKLTVPVTIDTSGKTDVTLPLQDWLNRQGDTAEINFQKNGNYRLDGTLLLYNRKSLRLNGNGARLFAVGDGSLAPLRNIESLVDLWMWPRKRSQLAIRDSRDIRLTNFVFEGANPFNWQQEDSYNAALEAQHNLDVEGVNGLQVLNCTFRHPWGDFIYLGTSHELSGDITQNVVVMQCSMQENGRQGISLVGTKNVVLALNDISKTRRSTFDIEPDADNTGTNNLFIRRNTVGEGRLMFVASGGTRSGQIYNVVIDRNALAGRPMNIATYGDGKSRHHWWIINNVGDSLFPYGSPRPLLEFYGADYVCVANNKHWFQRMDKDDLPGEGTGSFFFAGKGHYAATGNVWTDAEYTKSVSVDCSEWLKPTSAPSEFSQAALRKYLPSVAVGKRVKNKVQVFSNSKKAYSLYGGEGLFKTLLSSGSLATGYTELALPDDFQYYQLKVGSVFYTID